MNERIEQLASQAGMLRDKYGLYWNAHDNPDDGVDLEKFAELLLQDYAKKTIQGLMRDPAFAKAMDEHYKEKWAHRFD